ncbi:MAG: coproporphyrinogen dehydrogenase HemZ [Lachnospiraceae bacterium]|nr:coproporphyrinogen dehydrogenase HemZ [Lachnospiraceae bacterium]
MIIGLQLEENAFEQDIRELLMAFYPGAVFLYPKEDRTIREQAEEAGGLDRLVTGRFLDGRSRYQLTVENPSGGGPSFVDGPVSDVVSGAAENTARPYPDEAALSPVIREGLCQARENQAFLIDAANRAETKNQIKRRLYFLLMLDTGRQLPWGALTGIRPVKIPEGKLAEGWTEEEISSYMEAHYLTGEKKRKLSLEIAAEERRLLGVMDCKAGYSLYVGIPFCPTTCLYCSFTSYPIAKWSARLDEYLDILEQELQITREAVGGRKELQTIYVGGGTPTSLPEKQLARLMDMICSTFDFSALREFTVEAGRPDSITREKLQIMKDHGVSRISINPQSMNQKTLDLIGRRHTVEQVVDVFHMAREAGFDNINMDIILGLPGELKEEVTHTLDVIRELGPESLTVHCLALKRAARLNLEKDRYAEYPMAGGALIDELVEMAADEARAMGMTPYYLYRQKNMAGNLENVGYASGDMACLYNILMMEERHTVIGCGAGTTTKVVIPSENRMERLENIKNIQDYLPRFEEVLEKKKHFLTEMLEQW